MFSCSDCNSVSTRLPFCSLKGPHKHDFLDIYLTTYFRVSNFGNRLAMWVMSFSKIFKIYSKFKKCKKKNRKKVFCSSDDSIWIGCVKLSLLRRECLSLAVNVLTNSPKIVHITNRDFFQLNCLHKDQ